MRGVKGHSLTNRSGYNDNEFNQLRLRKVKDAYVYNFILGFSLTLTYLNSQYTKQLVFRIGSKRNVALQYRTILYFKEHAVTLCVCVCVCVSLCLVCVKYVCVWCVFLSLCSVFMFKWSFCPAGTWWWRWCLRVAVCG